MKKEIVLQQLDINDESSVLTEYTHVSGDRVSAGEPLLSCETAKAITEIVSDCDGYVFYCFDEGSEVPVHTVILSIFESLDAYTAHCSQKSAIRLENRPKSAGMATKKAIKLAEELGVSIGAICKEGLIKEADVRAHVAGKGALKNSTDDAASAVADAGPRQTAQKHFKYDSERVVIVGAGKGAEVLIDILLDDYDKTVVALVDDTVRQFTAFGRDYPVSHHGIYAFADLADRGAFDTAIISVSANLRSMQFRGRVYEYYISKGIVFTNVIAKSADIRRGVQIGQGNIIGANSYIGTKTVVGNNNLISYCAVVGHHNIIGDTNLLAPAMATSGSVTIGSHCIIPAGVNFINGVSVGNNVIFPVGYNVSVNVADSSHIKDRR